MATISRLSVDLVANSAQFRKDLDKAGKKSNSFFNNLDKRSQRSGKAFLAMGAALGAAFVKQSVEALGAFDEAMSDVQAKTQSTKKALEGTRKIFMETAKVTKFTAGQTAQAGTFLAQAGLGIAEIGNAIKPTLDLASATTTSVQQTADFMTNIMQGMGLTSVETERVADVLAVTTARSNTNLTDLAEAMKMAAPVARAMGMEIEQTSAMIGIMANSGIKGSLAGNAIKQAFSAMVKTGSVTEVALAGMTGQMTRQQKTLQKLGVHTVDAEGKTRNLMDVLTDLKAAGAGADDIFQIFGSRPAPALLAFMNEALDSTNELTGVLQNANGQVGIMAGTQLDNLNGDIVKMKSAFENISLIFSGSGLNELLRTATQFITDMLLSKPVEDFTKFIGKMADEFAVFAGILLTGGVVVGLGLAAAAMWSMTMAMLANPIGLIIVGIAALGVGVYKLVENFDFVKHTVKNWAGSLSMFFDNVFGKMSVGFHNFFTVSIPKGFKRVQLAAAKFRLSFLKLFNKFLGEVAEKVNKLIEAYNKLPLVDDVEKVTFSIDTSDAENKIATINGALDALEAKRQTFTKGVFTPSTFTPTGNEEDPNSSIDGGGETDITTEKVATFGEVIRKEFTDLLAFKTKYYKDVADLASGSWSNIIQTGSKGSKKLAMINKAMAIKDIIISTQQAIMKAHATLPFPANIPGIAKATIAGAIALNNVKGQAHDGIDSVPGTGTYLLEKGERVVDKRLNKDLTSALQSSNSTTTNSPVLNFNVTGSNAEEVEEVLNNNRGKFESMIRSIYNENAQNRPF